MAAPRDTVVLREHRPSPLRLAPAERDALLSLVPSLSLQPIGEGGGLYEANPGNAVGAVQLRGRRFELRPKIAVRRLLFLLSYSMSPRHWRAQGFDFDEDDDLFEAVVPGFAYQVEEALRGGPLLGYRQREDALQTVRGRIRFDEQLRSRFGRMPPVECRFDEFGDDVEAGRLIKAALRRVAAIRIRDPRTRRRLAALAPVFANVSTVHYDPRAIPEVSFDRLSERFRRPVELARLILRSRSIGARSGGFGGDAFVVDMAEVFEDFVVVALREALGLSERRFPQGSRGRPLHLDASKRLRLKPDLSWWERDRCLFVGDAKYKRTPPTAGVQHPDAYQLLAYTTATELPWGLLVYAAGEDADGPLHIPGADKQIDVLTLSLEREPADVLAQIEAIAERIRARTTSPPSRHAGPSLKRLSQASPHTAAGRANRPSDLSHRVWS